MNWATAITVIGSYVGLIATILGVYFRMSKNFTSQVESVRKEFRDERMSEIDRRLDGIEASITQSQEFNEEVDRHLIRTDGYNQGFAQGREYERQSDRSDPRNTQGYQ